MEVYYKSIKDIKKLLYNKEISSKELTINLLKKINERNEKLNAFITINERAIIEAERVNEKIKKDKEVHILTGIPYSLKDNIITKGILTTCGSAMLKDFIPTYDSTVNMILKDGILIGKTNLDEFGMGDSTKTSFYGVTKNPWNLKKVPGGSSGGSATAVAAGLSFYSLGSDTGGSIRQPAAFCGVVGLKPTYGLISRNGLISYGSSLDTIGPITRYVEDCAIVLNSIVDHDKLDSTSHKKNKIDYLKNLNKGIKNFTIGIPKEYFKDTLNPSIRNKIMDIIKQLEKRGAIIKEVSLPHTSYGIFSYYNIAKAEASLNLARFDGIRYGTFKNYDSIDEMYIKNRSDNFGTQVKKSISMGTYFLLKENYKDYYKKATLMRTLIKSDFEKVFKDVDILITPVTSSEAPYIDEKPDVNYDNDLLTININLAGVPAISVPCGKINNMPVGLQIIGDYFKEEKILRCAKIVESIRGKYEWNTDL